MAEEGKFEFGEVTHKLYAGKVDDEGDEEHEVAHWLGPVQCWVYWEPGDGLPTDVHRGISYC